MTQTLETAFNCSCRLTHILNIYFNKHIKCVRDFHYAKTDSQFTGNNACYVKSVF